MPRDNVMEKKLFYEYSFIHLFQSPKLDYFYMVGKRYNRESSVYSAWEYMVFTSRVQGKNPTFVIMMNWLSTFSLIKSTYEVINISQENTLVTIVIYYMVSNSYTWHFVERGHRKLRNGVKYIKS